MAGVVLKPFPYAGDGFTIEDLVPGDVREFGSAEPGLIADGYVAVAAAGQPVVEVESADQEDDTKSDVPADEPDDDDDEKVVESPRRGRARK